MLLVLALVCTITLYGVRDGFKVGGPVAYSRPTRPNIQPVMRAPQPPPQPPPQPQPQPDSSFPPGMSAADIALNKKMRQQAIEDTKRINEEVKQAELIAAINTEGGRIAITKAQSGQQVNQREMDIYKAYLRKIYPGIIFN